jgi:putative Holliday junction resolvase
MVERILALDVGDRRIGLAITDALGLTAQPLFTLHRTTQRADLKAIARFIRQHNVTTLVVGNPLHADGSPSPQSVKARAFAKALEAEHPALTHHLLDERLTTREAHELLDMAGRSPRPAAPASSASRKEMRLSRQEIIDQVAATLLLESFLAQRAGPSLLPDPDSES